MANMRSGLSQSLRMKQEMKVNPRLYQAMDLLYMPLLDLQQHLKQELLVNPFLDLIEPTDEELEDESVEDPEEDDDEIDWEEILLNGFDAGGRREEYEERDYYTPTPANVPDLWSHLREQLNLLKLGERERFLGEEIIGNIDREGFLACSLEEVVVSANEYLASAGEAAFGPAALGEDSVETGDGLAAGPGALPVGGLAPGLGGSLDPGLAGDVGPELQITPGDLAFGSAPSTEEGGTGPEAAASRADPPSAGEGSEPDPAEPEGDPAEQDVSAATSSPGRNPSGHPASDAGFSFSGAPGTDPPGLAASAGIGAEDAASGEAALDPAAPVTGAPPGGEGAATEAGLADGMGAEPGVGEALMPDGAPAEGETAGDATLRLAPFTLEEARAMLETIQGFDPSGVGARDLRECLLLQLRDRGDTESLAYRVVHDHFEELVNHRWSELSKEHGISPKEVQAAADEVAKLNPKPGLKYADMRDNYVVPDLIVEKIDGEYHVFHNDSSLPRLRLSRSYREVARDKNKFKGDNKAFISKKLNSAQWMIQAIEQRRQTMLKVMNFIVDRQREFFEKGVEHLRPLTLREVAEHIDMHESTVSRVTNEKYAQTPRGVLHLKFFFSSGLSTDYGEDVSARGIRARIEKLVADEDAHSPLTDQAIVDLLKKDGVQIARRTVAKYRDQLGILSARMRKRV